MSDAVYNTIGKTYDITRKPDPVITETLIELLHPIVGGQYLDIGCGSGNYTGALVTTGVNCVGVDISIEMLAKARKKHPHIVFERGDAMQLPFAKGLFAGAVCILATHHMQDKLKVFQEAYRVIKQGRFIIFTATPEQMQQYWLCHYFPKMMADGMNKMTGVEELKNTLKTAGFNNIQTKPFFVSNQLQDYFLQAGKYRPEIYLDPNVRQGISSFHLSADPIELTQGLNQLTLDIRSGKINEIIQSYESTVGDYLFVVGAKNEH